jgi:hypothetical protein
MMAFSSPGYPTERGHDQFSLGRAPGEPEGLAGDPAQSHGIEGECYLSSVPGEFQFYPVTENHFLDYDGGCPGFDPHGRWRCFYQQSDTPPCHRLHPSTVELTYGRLPGSKNGHSVQEALSSREYLTQRQSQEGHDREEFEEGESDGPSG